MTFILITLAVLFVVFLPVVIVVARIAWDVMSSVFWFWWSEVVHAWKS